MNYASTSNIGEVIKFYNLGDKTFETDFSFDERLYDNFFFSEKNLILREQDNCFSGNRRTLNYQRVNRSKCTFPFVLLKQIAGLATLFRQRTFITFLLGLFLRAVGRKRIFLFSRFIACINTHLYAKFKNNLSRGSV